MITDVLLRQQCYFYINFHLAITHVEIAYAKTIYIKAINCGRSKHYHMFNSRDKDWAIPINFVGYQRPATTLPQDVNIEVRWTKYTAKI